jgi:Domain of unknown function (DUF4224)
MSLFLSNSELRELTGYKLATKQTAWLQARGYYTEINARGIPRITYTQVEEMRRNNTPANLLFLNQQKPQVTNNLNHRNQPMQISASEPNFINLQNKINKVSKNG